MTKYEAIIADAESDYDIDLDDSFDPGVNALCNGDNCRSDECECWDSFRYAVREHLQKQLDRIEV